MSLYLYKKLVKIKKKRSKGFKMNSMYPKTMHRLPIINSKQRPYLTWLKNGIKTAEGRVNGPACQKMEVGDSILLFDNKNMQYLRGRIKFKHEYKTFEDMLQSEGIKNLLPLLPENATVEDGVRIYRSFPGSNRVEQFGCVAIGLEILDSKLLSFSRYSIKLRRL